MYKHSISSWLHEIKPIRPIPPYRILHFLKSGPKCCRLSSTQCSIISEQLQAYRGKIPSEFARQPRGIDELERWKATEFRQFLLYSGPLVLKDILPSQAYVHFLTLTLGISILLHSDSGIRHSYLEYSQELLHCFVRNCSKIYGETFNVYNVHNLLHLHEDVRYFDCSLNELSAFPFENHLQTVKKLVRKAQNPIAQIVKRQYEVARQNIRLECKMPKLKVSTRTKDSCFQLNNDDYAIIREVRGSDIFVCDVIHLRDAESFFQKPCDSKILNIIFIRNFEKARRKLIERCDLARKAMCLSHKRGFVMIPLRHGPEKY